LLFFRDDRGNFIRNIYVNDVHNGLDQLKERFQGTLASPDFNPSFHFVSAGELQCLLSMSRMFGLLGVRYETRNSRFASWNVLRESNLIFLGSSRTNPFVDSLQGENKFALTAETIVNTRPAPGEPECYTGSRYKDGKLEKVTEYAVVTRRPGVRAGCATTVISGNHGRAIEGAGDFLTTENQVQALLERMGLESQANLPSHFQVLLEVHMIDYDEEVAHVEPIAYEIIAR